MRCEYFVKQGFSILMVGTLVSCSSLPTWDGNKNSKVVDAQLPDDTVRPDARPEVRPETSDMAPTTRGSLGKTVVSLGTPVEQGMWLKTPLVSVDGKGRVTHAGRSVDVTLIPIKGAASAGSRISLQAMQTLGIPLTELTEVDVSAL